MVLLPLCNFGEVNILCLIVRAFSARSVNFPWHGSRWFPRVGGDVGVGGRAAAIGAWSRNLRVACFLPLSSQAFLLLILPTSWWRAFGSPWVCGGSRGSFGVCKGEWLLCLRIHRIVVLGMKIEVRRSIQFISFASIFSVYEFTCGCQKSI